MNLAYLALIALQTQQAEPLPIRLDRDVVTVAGKIYGLMPPEYVGGKGIVEPTWKPGNVLAFEQVVVENGKKVRQIKLYDAPKKQLSTLKLPIDRADFEWEFLNDRSAVVQFRGEKPEDFAMYNVSARGATLLWRGYSSPPVSNGIVSLATLRRTTEGSLRFLVMQGNSCVEVDSGIRASRPILQTYKDGFLLQTIDITPEGRGRVGGSYIFDANKLTFEKVALTEFPPDHSQNLRRPGYQQTPILRTTLPNLIADGDEKSEFPAAVIAADSDWGEFSVEGNYVAYRHGEHIFVRELRPLKPEDIDRIRLEEEKRALLSNAKQIGTALQIYLADHKDIYPGRDEKVTDLLLPYLKNERMMQGLVYTFEGGSASGLKDHGNTVIGYIQGKYGRALIYADSSARWESYKP